MRLNFTVAAAAVLAASAVLTASARAEDAKPIAIADIKRTDMVDFEKEILPLFTRSCLACHNASDAESDLVLETPQTIAKGGAGGASVMPGKGAESMLLKVAARLAEPHMPPPDNDRNAPDFKPEELGLLKLWIDQGAKGEVTGHRGPVNWQPLPPGVNPIYAVALSDDGQFAAAGRANQIFMYHVPTGAMLTRLTDPALAKMAEAAEGEARQGIAHLDIVQALEFHPGGRLLASGGFRTVKIWRRPENAQQLNLAGAGGDAVRTIAVSADRKWMATSGNDKAIKVWNLESGKAEKTLTGHADAVTGLAFSADGSKLASSSLDKKVRVWNVADGSVFTEAEAPAALNAVCLCAGDTLVVTAAADNSIYVHQLQQGDDNKMPEPKKLAGHSKPVTALAVLPAANTQFISGSEDGTARIWDATKGSQVRSLNHGAPVTSVAARPDGQRFASASSGNSTKLWDAAGKQLAEVKGDIRAQRVVKQAERAVNKTKALVAALKSEVAAAEKDEPVKKKALDDANKKQADTDKVNKEKAEAAKKPLADKAAAEKAVETAEAADKAAKEKLAKDKAELDKDKENKDKQKAVQDADKAAKAAASALADAQKKLQAATKPAADAEKAAKDAETAFNAAKKAAELAKVDLTRAQERVATGKKNFTAAEAQQKQQETVLEAEKKKSTESEKPFQAVAFSPDNKQFVAGGDDNLVHTYDANTGLASDVLAGHQGPVLALAFTADSGVVSGSADKNAVIWDLNPEWKLERTIGSSDDGTILVDRVVALGFSPDGKLLVTGSGEPSRSGELKIWNVADGKLVREIKDAHSDTVFAAQFSADGKFIASCAADKFIKIFETATGKFVRSFEGHTHHVLGVSWKTDGNLLASCGADKVIKIWDVKTGDQKRTIQGYTKQITSVRFIGDLDEVVTSSGDKSVRRHRAANGQNIRTFSGGTDYMYSAAATPDGTIVIGGGQDSVLRIWNGANGQVIGTFEAPKPEGTEVASGE